MIVIGISSLNLLLATCQGKSNPQYSQLTNQPTRTQCEPKSESTPNPLRRRVGQTTAPHTLLPLTFTCVPRPPDYSEPNQTKNTQPNPYPNPTQAKALQDPTQAISYSLLLLLLLLVIMGYYID